MKKTIFRFKDDDYTITELFEFHKTGKSIFKEGEVVNTYNGRVFDISEIYDIKKEYYDELNDIKDVLQTGMIGKNLLKNRIITNYGHSFKHFNKKKYMKPEFENIDLVKNQEKERFEIEFNGL